MDARASTSEHQHSFRSSSWPAATTPDVSSTASYIASAHAVDGSDAVVAPPVAASFPSLDFLPFLFPHQSNIYHAQLLHYNKLVSSRRGGSLQAPPLPPVVSAPHVHAGSRSLSSSKVSLKDVSAAKAPAAGGHESRTQSSQDKSRPVIARKDAPPRMPAQQQAAEPSTGVPQRSTAASSAQGQSHSSSVPSTPHQHACQFSFESRGPSPTFPSSHSPRSAYSETNSTLPSLRPLPPRFGGCKYETAQMNSRRRIPYSVGNERLEKLDPRSVKSKLSEDEEKTLAMDVRDMFDSLLPTDVVEANRTRLVGKLERIFNEEWPGHDIRAHLFGSSSNLLCSDDSDVDICITTPWHELEGVCMISNLLARRGMEKVVCISAAKVPIVKIWDPELGLACDMNVNNTLALENTRMVRTYVEADPRVRQLAMIIKYWTRRRIVNDAAFGGTLSSYTWICLIIAFLQLRTPPVLPALHQLPYKLKKSDGTVSDFADNLKKIRGFGSKNKSSVPELLFQFFRFYAHEFDYDRHVLSVRQGKLITKVDKKWNYQINNQLCVEEPFNVSRNLGNTADEYAFRGLHLELRRAFDLISAAKLGEACEQYAYPKEEEKVWTRPAQQSRPVLLRSSSQTHSTHSGRGGRLGLRGGRHNANFHRGGGVGAAAGAGLGGGGGSNRRASSSVPTYDNGIFMTPMNMQQEVTWYQNQNFSFQYAQQDLMTQMAYHHENMRQLQLLAHSPGFLQQPQVMGQQRVPAGGAPGQQPSDRSRTNSFDNVPMGATLRPDLYAIYGVGLGHAYYPPTTGAGYGTYPSSPATTEDFRRSLQRATVTTDHGASASSSSLRSQSQPASRPPSAAYSQSAYHRGSQTPKSAPVHATTNAHGVPIPSFMSDNDFDETPRAVTASPESSEDNDRATCSLKGHRSSLAGSAQPLQSTSPQGPYCGLAFGDLAAASGSPGRRRLSTDQRPQTILDRRMKRASRSPSPLRHTRVHSVGTAPDPLPGASPAYQGQQASRPLVVNGFCLKPNAMHGQRHARARETLQVEELSMAADLEVSPSMHGGSDSFLTVDRPATPSPQSAPERFPVVAGGMGTPGVVPQMADDASFRERVALMAAQHINPKGYQQETTPNGSPAHLSPSARQRWMARQPQNGAIVTLDLAIGDHRANKPTVVDSAHLSPVYETAASSPRASRPNENPWLLAGPDAQSGMRPAHAAPDEDVALDDATTPTERAAEVHDKEQALKRHKFPVTGARVNGYRRGARSECDGGWQKSGKGKKMVNAKDQQGQAEPPTMHESERKGG